MDDLSLKVELGAVRSLIGELRFSFVAKNSGEAHLQVYAHDPSDGRKAGVFLLLDQNEHEKLKSILEYADCVIRRMRKQPPSYAPKLRIACRGEDFGELSIATVKFMLESETLSLQDHYFDSSIGEWVELDRCPSLIGLF